MKWIVGGLLAALLFGGGAGAQLPEEEENTEMPEIEEEKLPEFEVELETASGDLNLRWEAPKGYDHLSYQVVAQVRQNSRTYTEIYRKQVSYTYVPVLSIAAYATQENGFSERMRFMVEAYDGYKLVASGLSREFHPADYFPEKTQYEFGRDISQEDIYSFWWHGTGTLAQQNFSYEAVRKDGEAKLYATYYDSGGRVHRAEKKLSDAVWEELIGLIVRGRVVRGSVADPDVVMLDGYSSDIQVLWNGMSEKEEKFCRYECEPEVSHKIEDLLKKHSKSSLGWWLAAAAAAAAAGTGFLLARKYGI